MRERLQSASFCCRQEHSTSLCVCALSCVGVLLYSVRPGAPICFISPAGPLVLTPGWQQPTCRPADWGQCRKCRKNKKGAASGAQASRFIILNQFSSCMFCFCHSAEAGVFSLVDLMSTRPCVLRAAALLVSFEIYVVTWLKFSGNTLYSVLFVYLNPDYYKLSSKFFDNLLWSIARVCIVLKRPLKGQFAPKSREKKHVSTILVIVRYPFLLFWIWRCQFQRYIPSLDYGTRGQLVIELVIQDNPQILL